MAKEVPTASDTGSVSNKVSVNGIRLHYWIGGDPEGDPVILWHGFLATGYVWRNVPPSYPRGVLSLDP